MSPRQKNEAPERTSAAGHSRATDVSSCTRLHPGGHEDETSPPTISASSRGGCHAPDRFALGLGAILSVAAGALDRRRRPRQRTGYRRAPAGTAAVETARPA